MSSSREGFPKVAKCKWLVKVGANKGVTPDLNKNHDRGVSGQPKKQTTKKTTQTTKKTTQTTKKTTLDMPLSLVQFYQLSNPITQNEKSKLFIIESNCTSQWRIAQYCSFKKHTYTSLKSSLYQLPNTNIQCWKRVVNWHNRPAPGDQHSLQFDGQQITVLPSGDHNENQFKAPCTKTFQ